MTRIARTAALAAAGAGLIAAASFSTLGGTTIQPVARTVTSTGTASVDIPAKPQKAPRPSNDAARYFGTRLYTRTRSDLRRAAYGWTNAHAKRVAMKKRKVKAHRARS